MSLQPSMAELLAAITASAAGVKEDLGANIAGVGRNVANLEKKVDRVVETVGTLVTEVEQQKEEVANLHEKFANMEVELRETREEVSMLKTKAPQTFSSMVARKRHEGVNGSNLQEQEEGAGLASRVVEQEKRPVREVVGKEKGTEEKIRDICEKSRRTVGFYRIGEDDILRMYGDAVPWGGAKTREQARKLAVREFMACEMKISPTDQDHMEIEDIFERKSENLDTVYVRFRYRSSLFRIFEKVKFLTNGRSNLVTYIPREFQERFQALNDILKIVRSEGEGWRTRVKMGMVDLIVSKKTKQRGAVYQELDLSDLPQLPSVCLNRQQTQVTNSPPPGRPGHGEEDERRKRRRSGLSPTGATPNNKTKMKESNNLGSGNDKESDEEEIESESEETVKEADAQHNITQRRKPGGYCGPATVSPVREGEGLLARPSVGAVSMEESMVNGMSVKTKKTKKNVV